MSKKSKSSFKKVINYPLSEDEKNNEYFSENEYNYETSEIGSEEINEPEINEIIYEDVDENGIYCRGKFIDLDVIIMKSNGYINVTRLCANATTQNGKEKRFRKWKSLDRSIELMNNISSDALKGASENLLIIIKTSSKTLTEIRGTYAHPLLIPDIAAWASTKFAVKVSLIIQNYAIKKAIKEKELEITKNKKAIKEKDDKIDKLNNTLKKFIEKSEKISAKNDKILKKNEKISEENKRILAENREINKRLKALQESNNILLKKNDNIINMLEKISESRVVSTGKYKDQHLIVIIKINYHDENNDDYYENNDIGDYYGMRIMRKSLATRISEIKAAHPFMEIIEYIPCVQNSMNIWHHVRDTIGKKGNLQRIIIMITNNYFNMYKKYGINDFIEKIKEIYNDRILDEDEVRNNLEKLLKTVSKKSQNKCESSYDE